MFFSPVYCLLYYKKLIILWWTRCHGELVPWRTGTVWVQLELHSVFCLCVCSASVFCTQSEVQVGPAQTLTGSCTFLLLPGWHAFPCLSLNQQSILMCSASVFCTQSEVQVGPAQTSWQLYLSSATWLTCFPVLESKPAVNSHVFRLCILHTEWSSGRTCTDKLAAVPFFCYLVDMLSRAWV